MPDEVVYTKSVRENDGKGTTHQDDEAETSGREKQVYPVLNLHGLDVEAGGDNASLVESAIELDDDFAGTVVINDFKLSDIALKSISGVR